MINELKKELDSIKTQFNEEIKAVLKDNISELKIKYVGRNGLVTNLFKKLGKLSKEERPIFGKVLNEVKESITQSIDLKNQGDSTFKYNQFEFDISLPGRSYKTGTLHPINTILKMMCEIFEKIGFSVQEGPEIEIDYNNFTALNIPLDHPARDMHDTFYFNAEYLLRTHTSPVQVRVMNNSKPPIRIIAPGKVFRKDSDITHSPMFHQVEGLYVSKDVNFGNLKSVLKYFVKSMFDDSIELRFRPSFFPFTEPSAEIDISCVICNGKGCRTCSNTGWLEILGAGMVDPNVLKNVNLDPNIYSGYAFGMGVERIAMLKYGINDIRLFYENHLDFLKQFNM